MKNKLNNLLIAGALTFTAQAVIAEEVVNVLNWSDYIDEQVNACLLYTSPSPRDGLLSRMPSSA